MHTVVHTPRFARLVARRVARRVAPLDRSTTRAQLATVIDEFCDNGEIAVVRFKDRFVTPLAGGWRDVTINYYLLSDERKHICEAQLVHTSMQAQPSRLLR